MHEELSADHVEAQSFSSARRGYDKEEVDTYLRSLADEIRAYQAASTERLYQNLGEEMGGLLQHARDSADAMLKEAEEDAAATRHKAERDAHETRAEAQRQADEIRAAADADATERIKQADDRVQSLEGIETDTRNRLVALRQEVESVVTHLASLDRPQADEVQLDEQAPTDEPLEVRLEDDARAATSDR
jgi:DivIVA domain-containing protein